MARRFLYFVAALIALAIGAGIAWSLYSDKLLAAALVPSAPFVEQQPLAGNVYADKTMWYARPELTNNPAQWLPEGYKRAVPAKRAAVFFIHPTSYIDNSGWNATLDNERATDLAQTFIRGQASAFNGVGDVWAPRYRQATLGAFLTTQPEATRAIDAAYGDVARAFDAFVASIPADMPIVLAGHSQGGLHLTRLLRERVAGRPVARRIVAAYVVGWPVSTATDLRALGLPACTGPDQAGCILSWQTYAEPADPKQVIAAYDATTGFDGRSRSGTRMLCINPLTGTPDSAAPAQANLGTLVPDENLKNATLEVGKVPARCDAAQDGGRGFLLIGPPPEKIGTYVLPGNNYHVFDYSLFWGSVRADVARRLAAFVPGK